MVNDAISVLLVEDNLADVALLKELLQDSHAESWKMTHVKRLKLALQQLQTIEFDVILLDLSLPDSQGLDTITQVHAAVPHLPVVVLTGLQDKSIALQAVALGAQDYLVKGQLTSELLMKTVSYAIGRAQILKRLQESEHRFRGVFNQTFQFMALLSPSGVVLEANQATRDAMGFSEDVTINALLWEVPHWRILESSQSWLKMAVLQAPQGETLRSELQSYTAQGVLSWLDVSIKPLRNENGDVALLIAEGRDISKLKQAEAEIRQSLEKERELNRMKNTFISMVSHEFRNPLTTIRFSTDLLQNYQLSEEKKAKHLGNIQMATSHMLELLNEILLLGRTEAGKVEVKNIPIDLASFCSEIVKAFQFNNENQHPIFFSVNSSSTQAHIDTSLLKHILENLLSNAIKYSLDGETVQLSLTCQSDRAEFCIQDRGIGIPQKDLEKLFEPFHRAGNVSKIQGTGLGLAIVKRYVDLLNGQISVESQEGVGTTFTVILPRNLTES